MSDFLLVLAFVLGVIGQIFTLIDSWILFDTYSWLDILVAFEFASITIWGIFEIIDPKSKNEDGN